MLGMELLSAGMGVSNVPQGWQEDRLAANAAKTRHPSPFGSWSGTVRPQTQPHSRGGMPGPQHRGLRGPEAGSAPSKLFCHP